MAKNLPTGDADVLADVAVGNDKTFTADAGRFYETVSFRLLMTTTATGGNRQLRVEIRDSSANVLFADDATSVVAASQTDVEFLIFHSTGDPVLPPNGVVPPGGDIRFYDSADIDVLDTFAVRGVVLEYVEVEV